MSNLGHETADKRPGTGNANWFIAGILVVAILLAGIFLFGGTADDRDDLNVNVETPAAATEAADDAATTVEGAANDAANAIEGAADDAATAVEGAADDAATAVEGAAEEVEETTTGN